MGKEIIFQVIVGLSTLLPFYSFLAARFTSHKFKFSNREKFAKPWGIDLM